MRCPQCFWLPRWFRSRTRVANGRRRELICVRRVRDWLPRIVSAAVVPAASLTSISSPPTVPIAVRRAVQSAASSRLESSRCMVAPLLLALAPLCFRLAPEQSTRVARARWKLNGRPTEPQTETERSNATSPHAAEGSTRGRIHTAQRERGEAAGREQLRPRECASERPGRQRTCGRGRACGRRGMRVASRSRTLSHCHRDVHPFDRQPTNDQLNSPRSSSSRRAMWADTLQAYTAAHSSADDKENTGKQAQDKGTQHDTSGTSRAPRHALVLIQPLCPVVFVLQSAPCSTNFANGTQSRIVAPCRRLRRRKRARRSVL